jgi:hypothetical protein
MVRVVSNFDIRQVQCAWMKVKRKLSKFSAEKQKRNENMKTKTEICGMEMETEIFWQKWK